MPDGGGIEDGGRSGEIYKGLADIMLLERSVDSWP